MRTLKEFLKEVNWKEEDIISYEWEEALEKVKENWYALKFVNNQTEEICLAAVKQNWRALQYINNQTEEICLDAVKENWFALQYVNNQTEEICLEAVKENWSALQFVDKSIFKKEEEETITIWGNVYNKAEFEKAVANLKSL